MKLSTLEQIESLHSQNKLIGCFEIEHRLYHDKRCPGLSKTKLDWLDIKHPPEYFKYMMDNPKEPSKDMLIGLALHCLMLEPEEFDKLFIVSPMKGGSKKYDEWKEENVKGRTILTETIYDKAKKMSIKLKSKPMAMKLLSGFHEKAFFWRDPITGILCKCKPDSIHATVGLLADLKKSKSASPEGFIKSVYEFSYHVQAAFYMDGVRYAIEQSGENPWGFKVPDVFTFIAQEAEAPFTHGYYDLEEEFIEEGREEYRWRLRRFKRLEEEQAWNESYSEKIIKLKSKSWMYKERKRMED